MQIFKIPPAQRNMNKYELRCGEDLQTLLKFSLLQIDLKLLNKNNSA